MNVGKLMKNVKEKKNI